MKRFLVVTVVAFLGFVNGARAEPYLLVAKSAVVAKTKADGSPWDVGVGKKAWPDPFVKVWVYDAEGGLADSGETAVIFDTFTPAWNQDIATVTAGCKVKLEVWDKDVKHDDLIGKHEFKVTDEMLQKGELALKFGQVEKLNLAFRAAPKNTGPSRVLLQQAFPGPHSAKNLQRSEDAELAVVLIHGLDLREDGSSPKEPRTKAWQGSTSPLVRALSRHADVFAVSYAQTQYVEEIAAFPELHSTIGKIKALGYKQVVLVGHSAGGLLARHFVEDRPDAGVTRVIQVATPNAGASYADWGVRLGQVHKEQQAFVNSLGPAHRTALLKTRDKPLPPGVEFVTVVCAKTEGARGDGVVTCHCQWPLDLQQQRTPCFCVQATHVGAMVHDDCVKLLCDLAMRSQPRWTDARVKEMRKELGFSAK